MRLPAVVDQVHVRGVVHDRAAAALRPANGGLEGPRRGADGARVRRIVEVERSRVAVRRRDPAPSPARAAARADRRARERRARRVIGVVRVGEQQRVAFVAEAERGARRSPSSCPARAPPRSRGRARRRRHRDSARQSPPGPRQAANRRIPVHGLDRAPRHAAPRSRAGAAPSRDCLGRGRRAAAPPAPPPQRRARGGRRNTAAEAAGGVRARGRICVIVWDDPPLNEHSPPPVDVPIDADRSSRRKPQNMTELQRTSRQLREPPSLPGRRAPTTPPPRTDKSSPGDDHAVPRAFRVRAPTPQLLNSKALGRDTSAPSVCGAPSAATHPACAPASARRVSRSILSILLGARALAWTGGAVTLLSASSSSSCSRSTAAGSGRPPASSSAQACLPCSSSPRSGCANASATRTRRSRRRVSASRASTRRCSPRQRSTT